MVINREFFFRGWLPAGLLVNARLCTSPSSDGSLGARPLLNPSPESAWPAQQPPIAFPVTQATDDKAILLVDALPDGAIAMLPLEAWYGSGSPYLLATNTWYEGRIREVSGEDVMSVRIHPAVAPLQYYSYYSGLEHPDVMLYPLPCRWIPGVRRDVRAFKDANSKLAEIGYVPTVAVDDTNVPLPILDVKKIESVDLAGMRMAYSSQSPAGEAHFIECEFQASPEMPIKFVGLIASVNANVQNFYSVSKDSIAAKFTGPGLIKTQTISVLSTGGHDEQVLHYN